MIIIIDILIGSSILGSVLTTSIILSSKEPNVSYNYIMETDDKIQRCIGWGQSMIIYVDDGHTFLILDVEVHNHQSEPIYVQPSCFHWRSHDVDILALNREIKYWYHIDPYSQQTQGYVQPGTSLEIEIIFDIPVYMVEGDLLPWDLEWDLG